MDKLMLEFGEDGKVHAFKDDFDVAIHCHNEQELQQLVALINVANRMRWRKTADCPPTAKDSNKYGYVLSASETEHWRVTNWDWHEVASNPDGCPVWMPVPELPGEENAL